MLVGVLLLGVAVWSAPPASAACHAFMVEVEPATVAEGGEVTVTVSRDAGVGPSQIDVETVDGTARGGSDYEAVARRTVSFSSETEQTFKVPTMDDAEGESAETFALHLSNPGGCTVNPNFVVGPDAQVTISDNDSGATTTSTSTGPTTTAAGPTTTVADEDAATSTTALGATSSSTSTTDGSSTTTEAEDVAAPVSAVDDDDDDGGASGALVALAALVVIAAAGAGVWTWRRRRTAV